MQLVVVMAVRKAVSAATITFTATSMTFFFMIHLLSIYDFQLLISNIRLPTSNIIHLRKLLVDTSDWLQKHTIILKRAKNNAKTQIFHANMPLFHKNYVLLHRFNVMGNIK